MLATILAAIVALTILSSAIIITTGIAAPPGEQQQTDPQDNKKSLSIEKNKYASSEARIRFAALDRMGYHQILYTTTNNANANSTPNDVTSNNNSDSNNKMTKNNNNNNDNNKDNNNNNNNNNYSAAPIASCGQVVTKDVILSEDLECTGIGMIAGKDGITIQLNGHKLSLINTTTTRGTTPALENIGILIAGYKNVTIVGPGIITGFDKGVEFAGSKGGYILDLKLTENKIGISLKVSNGITIYRNFIDGNTIGIASQSSRSWGVIAYNQIIQNANQGVMLMDSHFFIISANTIIKNGKNGIFLDVHSSDNTLLSNNILSQTVDINNADGIPINISQNVFVENSCHKALPDGLC
jgi:parallel beta-helix repeat protein